MLQLSKARSGFGNSDRKGEIFEMKRLIGILTAIVMLLTCCLSGALAEPAKEELTPEDIQSLNGGHAVIRTDGGRITFVGGTCTDAPVKNPEDAAKVVARMIPLIGSSRTRFEPWRTLYDSFGNTYYVFQQIHADTIVDGGAAKVITDRDGNMLGLTCSAVTDLPEETAAEGISASAAEQLVLQHEKEQGLEPGLMEGMTRKIVLPAERELDLEADEIRTRFVWAVFTTNPKAGSAELPYLAHYVSLNGEYLYSLSTQLPGDSAGTAGYHSDYVFEFMEPVEYTGYVDLSDGTEKEITVNVMRDTRTGMYYLGNIEHRIVVADCWEFLYNHGHVKLEYSPDNREWDQVSLLSLYNYCRAYDYYKALGWQGDGENTPIIVLKDFCDEEHKPLDNAAYAGKFYGWQAFLSSSANDFAQCLDIIAHEFTHCVTASVMTYSAYLNDFGAINEAMSDIQGNICEMLAGDTEDSTWTVGENSGDAMRSMSDPHQGQQPEYTWDMHYMPHVKDPTDANDNGGVHTNSSLLSRIGYLLWKGGMSLEDSRAYWFAVDCAMVPGTDFAQLRDLLPWILKITGLESHGETLSETLAETKLGESEMPASLPEDQAMLTLDLPDTEIFNNGNWLMNVICLNPEAIEEKVDRISEDLENGKTEGYPQMLIDMYSSAKKDLEENPSADPEEKPSVLGILLDSFLDGAMEGEPAEPAPGEAAGKAAEEEFTGWIREQFGDIFYQGSGSAGQDGHTIRMMTLAGRAVPMLMYMETKPNSEQIKQMNIVIFLNGRWIDVTPFFDMPEGQESPGLVDLGKKFLESGLLFDVLGILFTCRTAEDFLNALTRELPGGQVTALPSNGLENITFEANMADTVNAGEVTTNNRMSRPKE